VGRPFTRDELVARLVRAGELEASGAFRRHVVGDLDLGRLADRPATDPAGTGHREPGGNPPGGPDRPIRHGVRPARAARAGAQRPATVSGACRRP
jgi:hypothetical protein